VSIVTLALQRPTSGVAPFTFGQAFKLGDVPAGSSVTAAEAISFQAVAKNAWPDGSLKFAVLSGTANVTANTPFALTLDVGAAAAGTALTTADLKATGVVASVDAGAFGSASWADADWDTPAQAWISGPVMSSWLYRKAVGTDAHLVAWLEVRLYASGAVEVLPWIENGYINVANPSNRSATYTFSLGGTERFAAAIDLKHHQRTVLISGTALSYWLGTDPGVTPLHDRDYLQATELVPSYSATPAANATVITNQASSYVPLQAGGFVYYSDNMAETGYQSPIGLLPEHDMVYLVGPSSAQANLFASVNRNGFSAGRYGIHYRDESTQKPLRFSSYPTLVIRSGQGFKDAGSSSNGQYTPVVSGGAPPTWDVAHSPSVGFLAYLLTGRHYFMEEAQFAATCDYLGNGSVAVLRNGAQGLMRPCPGAWQVRACAWQWRHTTQALCITPDADTVLQSEFQAITQTNIDHFYNTYVAQANNPFGFIQNAAGYTASFGTLAPWQQDFVTAAFGYSLSMGLPLTTGYQNKLSAFFQWTAKSVVGRLSAVGAGGWPYINADPYVLSISTASLPDWTGGTGPWRASWDEVYSVAAATLAAASAPSSWMGTTDGTLRGEIMPGAHSLWGNLMPAIAYAVRHGVAGAADGLTRIKSATNYSALTTAFNTLPVFSVEPAFIPSESTGMGKSLRIDTTDLIGGSLVIGDTGLGVLGADIRSLTATGGSGAGPLYNDWDPGDDDKEFQMLLLSQPSSGTLFVDEYGRLQFTGAPDGTYSFSYRLYVDRVDRGTATVSMSVGSAASCSFALTTDEAVFAGSAYIRPSFSMAVTTDAAVFAGSASVTIGASFSITTDDAVFNGAAFSVPQVFINVSTDDAVFSGTIFAGAQYPSPEDVRYGVTYGPNNSLVGTMVGGGGVHPDVVATAVWSKVIEGGLTAESLIRLLVAQAIGNAAGLGTSALTFSSLDGTKVRVEGTLVNGVRSVTVVDAD
jgi:hypothetical protein